MKKIVFKVLILCMAICSALCVFAACGGGTNIELSFVVDNEIVQTVKTTGSELIEIPDDPEKTGYTFDGWYWDKDVWEKPFTANSLLNAPISKNMSIYAKFKAIEYTATFMADEEQVGTAKFTIEDTEIANIPQVPEKVGYKGVWEEYTIKTEDITINAVYIINKYTVIWQNEDGTVLKTDENVEHGTVLEYDGETPQKAADAQYTYTFDKWEPVVSEITGDITYTATYSTTVNKYTVVWKNYDGTVLETDNDVPYGEMPEYNGAEPTKTENQQYSYVFKNEWSPVVETVKGNSEYIAQFIQVTNKYKITFYDEDGTTKLGESTVDYGTNATYPNDTPTKASDNGYNYTFNKWLKLETTEEDNLENVIDNREVYAKYTATPRVYNVYYVENGGNDINNTTYTYSVGLSVLPDENDISRTGYTFEGWKDAQNNAITAISTEMYGDITLYADWQTITYYASFYADATLVDTKPFTVEDTAIANIPAVPEKTGYTGEWEGYAILAENITINAVYAPIECTITYVNIKTATNNNQTKYNIESEKITLADLDNIDGYNFNCWLDEDGNKITEITSGSFGHREITAKWDIVEFTIDYADVKTAINNNIIKYTIESDTIILINLDNIDGYNFNCWLDEKGNKITEIPTGSFGNREIAAKWDLVEFDIVYANIKTATNNNITKYTIESDTITLINLNDIDGYNFNCWLDEKGNKITEIPAGSFGNREITAKWDLVEFDISYTNLKTASNGNKVKYTIESAKITLIDLDNIDGYNFNCWLDEDDNKITEIPAGSFGNREITAKWDVIEFTINYADVKTAANNNLTKYTIESAKITLADLDNIDGYNFNCWLDEDGNKITEIPAGSFGHREITAKWDLVEFDLILNYEAERGDYAIGTSNPNKYTIESDITLTELVCNNTGYIFIGWFTEKNNGTGVKVERIKDRTGTISLYAQWDLEDYSITYYGVNNAVNTNLSNYTVETETFTIDNLSRTGYTFDGWFNSDDTVANTTITKGSIGNKAFYAKWTAIEYDIEYVLYDGTYVADENPAKYTIESSIVFNGLTKDGYRFDGWFDAAQGGNKLTGISVGTCGNKTVYAHWTYISTITYNSNGGSAVSPTINPAGTVITAPVAPTKDYYEFVGWFNSSLTEEFVFEVQPSEDITLYAKWEPVKYNITYVLNGGNNGNNPAQYTVEQKVELKDASKTGYTFVGWFTDELFTSVTVEEISLGSHGEIVLYANYSINQYTISFETNGGTTIADITQNYATTVNAPSDPAKNGYTFSGWYFDSALKNAYTFTTMPADNITVYAKWTLVNYGITYNLNGGTNGNNPAKYTITSSDITLKNPTKTGYEFKGWFTDSNYQNAITVIANGSYGDIELFAKWKIITYTVTYVLPDGATHTNPTSYTIETATVSLTDAEKTGYTFNGWFDAAMNGNSVTTFAGGAIGNLTIYGRFTVNDYTVWLDGSEEAAYTVEFNLNGKNGTAPAMQTITENNTLKYPTVPTCEGYVFAGWFDNENCEGKAFDFAAIVNENTVLYAKWIAVGGNNVISVNGTAVVTLNGANDITYMFVPLNSGNVTITTTGSYDTFGALYSDQGVKLVQDDDTGTDSNFQIIYNVTANKAYYIKVRAYSSAITGTCTLYLSGDNTVADGGYTVTSSKTTVTFDADFTLAVPEARDGYKFLGWQDENGVLYTDGTGASVKTWDKAETTVLYSKWERTVYTINFVTNGGSAVDPVTFAFGDRIDLNDYVTTLANKSFLGWYASNTDTERYNATYMPDHNLTLYAKWTNYALGEIKYNADKVAIKETDELTAELFGAVCLDTDGNFANITVTLSGTQVAGETVSIRLVATNNGKTKQKTVSGVRVYGIPTLTFDNTVDYLNLKDGLTAEWIRAIGTDSFGGSTEIRFTIAVEKYPNNYYPVHSLNDCNGGDHIVANIYAVDAAGNQKMLTTGGLIVYDLPVITYKEEKTAISVNNVINAELFSATATDSCGENLTVSVMVYDGTISAGNTVTIRLTAIDSKGNIQIIDKQVEVYGMPTIDNATTLDFKVEDEITVNSLGLTAKDTYNNPLEIALTVKSGTQTAGATMVFTATVTDIAGNITTKDISAKIYGTPTITYNRNALKVSENPTSNANLLNTVAKDSFDGGLTVTATLKSGELKGGEYVVYTLTAVDKLGNVATIDTALIPVYAVNDIKFTDNVNYFSGATDTIKLDSKGEEFYASITDTFGGLCDITIEPATGYTLKAGNTIDIHLVATDKAGNSVRSDLITGIKVYGTPTYVMNQDVVYEDTDLDFFFTVYDSFGEELYYEIIVEGEQVGGKVITISLAATDDFGNSLNEQLIVTVSVGNLIFTKNTDGSAYILSSFSGNVSEAIIPTEFGGIPVTAIAARVFERCTNLTKVVIPDSVTTIGMRAFAMCSKLTNVTIGSSVTSIGDEAFSGCSSLTSITIPDSVTSIGSSAFYNCSGLTSVTIGNSVTSIGNSAFNNCSSLTSITIPNSVTSIGDEAFSGCSSLTSITIPDSVTSIGSSAFYNCSGLTRVTLSDSVTSIGNRAFYNCSSLTSITIGNSVTSIEDYAFCNCSSLTSITIPNSVTSIGYYAFYNCSSLTSVTIPDSVTSIGEYTFGKCTSLQELTIPFVGAKAAVTSSDTYQMPFGYIFCTWDYTGGTATQQSYYSSSTNSTTKTTYYIPSSLTKVTVTGGNILYGAFYNCSGLTRVTLSDSVTSIGNRAFYNCSSLTSITIGNSVTSIEDYAFCNCSSLASVTIPDSVTSIGEGAFKGCSGLCSVVIKNGIIKRYAFMRCTNLVFVELQEGVRSIESLAFWDCNNLETLIVPNSVMRIGGSAFKGCEKIKAMTLPFIGESHNSSENNYLGWIFNYYEGDVPPASLKTLTVEGGTIGANAFIGCKINDLTIGYGVSIINNSAFDNFTSLKKLTIYGSVINASNIKALLASCTQLNNVTFDIGNKYFYSQGGIVYNRGKTEIVFVPKKIQGTINIIYGVVNIGDGVFNNYNNIQAVIIPDSVKSIGGSAFRNCSSLTSVTIGNSVTSIGGSAFSGCSGLTSITIPNSVTSIGDYAFSGCSSLTSITIPNSVTSIGRYAFENCSGLKSITIPNSVTSIGSSAFENCSSLTSVTLSDSVTSIGGAAFRNCTKLTSITIPDNVTSIGISVFENCSSLTSVTIPDSVTSIEGAAFRNCTKLTSITIPDSAKSIGGSAFYNCSSLTSITIPNSVTSVGEGAFSGCSGLTSIIATSGNTGYHSSGNCLIETSSKTLILGCKNSIIPTDGSVTSIGGSAFSGCSGLTSITIPNSVTSIGDYAFSGCSSLTSITIPNSVTSIGSSAFENCSGLKSITIPNSVTSIGYCAFSGCSKLTSATFINTSGWKVSRNSNMSSPSSLLSSDLSNTSTAASYLTSRYKYNYWKRG